MAVRTMSECAAMLKALADPTRLAVVRQLIDGPSHVGGLNRRLQIEPSLLSHHLRVLREVGLVEASRDGKRVLYRLSPAYRAGARTTGIDFGCCQLVF